MIPLDRLGPEIAITTRILARTSWLDEPKMQAEREWWAEIGREQLVVTTLPETTVRPAHSLPVSAYRTIEVRGYGRKVLPAP